MPNGASWSFLARFVIFHQHGDQLEIAPQAMALLQKILPNLVSAVLTGAGLLLALLDELFLSLAGLRVALWLLLELPAGLGGWWRRPPELLLELLTMPLSRP